MTQARPAPEPADPPPAAASVFGDRLDLARAYAGLLATDGVEHGLLGPREVPRLWERHLLNCAVLGELVPAGARVVDVGSGAGLPGLVLALARPDLRVDLVEPLLRRSEFLHRAVRQLGLGATVRVVRGRAEEGPTRATIGGADVVVSRAVAPLDKLLGWCLPLARPGGVVLAMKGRSADDEIASYRAGARRSVALRVEIIGTGVVDDPVRVVVAEAGRTRARESRR